MSSNSFLALASRASTRSTSSSSSIFVPSGTYFNSCSLSIFSIISPHNLTMTAQFSQTASWKSSSSSHFYSSLICSILYSSILHLDSMVLHSSSKRPISFVSSFFALRYHHTLRLYSHQLAVFPEIRNVHSRRNLQFLVTHPLKNSQILKLIIIFLKFVMKAQSQELDYEEDVAKLKQVWQEIKEPNKRAVRGSLGKNETATQTRTLASKVKNEGGKSKVIVSEQNMKKTVRNPKSNPDEVIEVVTRPEKMYSDPISNEKYRAAPELVILTNPEGQHLVQTEDLRKAITQKDYELSLLRVSNSHNEDKIKKLEAVLEARDETIQELRERERQLTNQLAALNSKDFNFNYGKVQYQNYRHDSRRLLKMLKTTEEYNKFAEFALDDDGVRFLTNVNKTVKTKLDTPAGQSHFHFCTCNKAFIPQPLLWVPEKAYDFGKEFIKSRNGELSQTQLELLLYELNKLWREREKRIINHISALKTNEIGKYKRKIQDASRGKEKTQTNE